MFAGFFNRFICTCFLKNKKIKKELETALNSGTLDTDELVRSSQRIAEIIDLLDEKEMRWLELSEIE